MDPVILRITTYDGGSEKKTLWSFSPLRNIQSHMIARETGADGEGRLRREAHSLRDRRKIKLPAALLLQDVHYQNFLRMLMSKKIEMQRFPNGKAKWVEYDLDAETLIEYENLEDLDRVRSHTFTIVESDSLMYTDFEARIKEIDHG